MHLSDWMPGLALLSLRRRTDPEDSDYASVRRMIENDDSGQHCSAHSGQMEFVRSVNTKLNWCLGGLATLLTAMAYLLLAQIDYGKISTSHQATIQQHDVLISTTAKDVATLESRVGNLERRWDIMDSSEKFIHGTGIERHHLKPGAMP